MKEYILICNSSVFDIQKAFEKERTVTWTLCKEMSVGDIVYFYVTDPYRAILYKCKVTNVDLLKMDESAKECVKHIMFYERQQNYMRLELLESYPEGLITDEEIKKFGISNLQTVSSVPPELSQFIKSKTESVRETDKPKKRKGIFIMAAAVVMVIGLVCFFNSNFLKSPSNENLPEKQVMEINNCTDIFKYQLGTSMDVIKKENVTDEMVNGIDYAEDDYMLAFHTEIIGYSMFIDYEFDSNRKLDSIYVDTAPNQTNDTYVTIFFDLVEALEEKLGVAKPVNTALYEKVKDNPLSYTSEIIKNQMAFIWRNIEYGGDLVICIYERENEGVTVTISNKVLEKSTNVNDEASEKEDLPKYKYVIYKNDCTWQEAKAVCEANGGHLATITSEEEYLEICKLAAMSDLTYLWLGGVLYSETDEWEETGWITGEEWEFEKWYPGEPSKEDKDGAKEYYLCLWKAKYEGEEIGWTFNDQRNDVIEVMPSISGNIGFVCEYEME